MSKHIGIVACSAEGAALCYRTICMEGAAVFGRHGHPEVSLHTHPLSEYMRFIYDDRWEGVAELMLSSAHKLAACGADFLICPDNTIHQVFDQVEPRSPLPWLHIAREVGREAARRGFRHLGLMGTRYLMEGPVYPSQLAPAGILHTTPGPEIRSRINSIIFEELVNGIFLAESHAYLNSVIGQLKEQGCDAVILGCTELPLIVTAEDSPLPTLDSTRLLARAALRHATDAPSGS